MKVRILGSNPEDPVHRQYFSSYLVNGGVVIDAGCVGQHRKPQDQAAVGHVFLTHSHLDHTASLPVFLENVYGLRKECPVIYAPAEVLAALRRDMFNDIAWPDFFRLSNAKASFLQTQELHPETTVEVEGLRIAAVPVNHGVPTFAYIVTAPDASVIFAADSGPTERLWEVAAAVPNLRAAFLEASFPNDLQWLADVSGHLTPNTLRGEAAKLRKGVRLIVVHIKPRYQETVLSELSAFEIFGLEIGECEHDYEF